MKATRTFVMSSQHNVGTQSAAMSFHSSAVLGAVRSNSATTGSMLATIGGSGFGAAHHSLKTRLTGSACEATVWLSDTSAAALVGSGAAGTLIVSITAGERTGSGTDLA
eukprot:3663839-Rhodomonas_salina.1